jgi:hyperosmotically inducible protein
MRISIVKAVVLGVSLASSSVFAASSDSMITAKAKLALWTSDVRSRSVQVDTNDGVLTLSGKVPSAEQKALAEKKAREIEGVKEVKSYLQVVPAAEEKRVERSDDQLEDAVKTALKNDESLEDSKITVKDVSKGVVRLGGEAKTYSDHLRAIGLVDRTPGVKRVTSEVKNPKSWTRDERGDDTSTPRGAKAEVDVDQPKRSGPADASITASVKMRLLTTAEIPSMKINVDTVDNVVTLFGIVPTEEVKRTAEAEASRVKGVASVKNHLQVVASSEKEAVKEKDEDLTRALEAIFKDREELERVDWKVKNGVVQLTGRVASREDEYEAVRAARSVKGIRNVVNQLKVDEQKDEGRTGS